MHKIHNLSLNKILDEDFLKSLAKSADLYKIGSNSVLDPEEIRIGLKVVPRAVMSLLINALTPMPLNSSIELNLPFGKNARINANKNAADDYTGSVYDNNKLVYDFKNRSIPGLGIILLSTFELYQLEDLKDAIKPTDDAEAKIQKLVDERMKLYSIVSEVVDNKLSEREALNKLMMDKLSEALSREHKKNAQIAEVRKIHEESTPQSNPYFQGMTNGIEVANSIANKKNPTFVEASKKKLDFKADDMVKKEEGPSKGSPLKKFIEQKKKKAKEYRVEIAKSETVNCPDCNQTIFGQGSFSCCLCYGQDQHKKIWIKKSEESIQIRFSRDWDKENIQMLLDTLRAKHEKD